jgi:hypothetical protein
MFGQMPRPVDASHGGRRKVRREDEDSAQGEDLTSGFRVADTISALAWVSIRTML